MTKTACLMSLSFTIARYDYLSLDPFSAKATMRTTSSPLMSAQQLCNIFGSAFVFSKKKKTTLV